MGTFRSKEHVDARQLTDGKNFLEMTFWVQSREGRAESYTIDGKPEFWLFEHYAARKFTTGYSGDWVIHHQDGSFELMRNEEFVKRYEQL